jgi:hypothetical protein
VGKESQGGLQRCMVMVVVVVAAAVVVVVLESAEPTYARQPLWSSVELSHSLCE